MFLLTRCRISMCQGLGPKKHDEISEIDRNIASRKMEVFLASARYSWCTILAIFCSPLKKVGSCCWLLLQARKEHDLYIYIYIYVYIHIQICVCVYICIYIYIYICGELIMKSPYELSMLWQCRGCPGCVGPDAGRRHRTNTILYYTILYLGFRV